MIKRRVKGRAADPNQQLLERYQLTDESFHPDETLAHFFSVVAGRISGLLQKMYTDRYGLTVIGWRLIAILHSRAPLSAKELSDLTATDSVTISRALDVLSSKSLLLRRVDPKDRRRAQLRLSKRGVGVYNQIAPVLQAAEAAMLSSLEPAEMDVLRKLMLRIADTTTELFQEDTEWQSILIQFGKENSASARVPDEGDILEDVSP